MACEHNEARLHWIPDIEMWERRCPCGLNAYGMTLPNLDRVWRRNVGANAGGPSARGDGEVGGDISAVATFLHTGGRG